jgi:hypothetical protein
MNSALAGSVMWAGGITPTEAHFRVSGYQGQTFLVSPNEDLSSPLFQFPITSERSSFNVRLQRIIYNKFYLAYSLSHFRLTSLFRFLVSHLRQDTFLESQLT